MTVSTMLKQPRIPSQALLVLALQIGAALAALAPVFYFNL